MSYLQSLMISQTNVQTQRVNTTGFYFRNFQKINAFKGSTLRHFVIGLKMTKYDSLRIICVSVGE